MKKHLTSGAAAIVAALALSACVKAPAAIDPPPKAAAQAEAPEAIKPWGIDPRGPVLRVDGRELPPDDTSFRITRREYGPLPESADVSNLTPRELAERRFITKSRALKLELVGENGKCAQVSSSGGISMVGHLTSFYSLVSGDLFWKGDGGCKSGVLRALSESGETVAEMPVRVE